MTLASCLATAAMLAGGCVMTPRQPAPTVVPNPQAVTQNVMGPAPATSGPVVDSSVTFRETATDEQRFHVHLDFGRVFESEGNFEAAIQEYQDALTVAQTRGRRKFKPADSALAHRRMAAAWDRLGRFDEAETHYKQALKLSPKDPKVWNDAGYSYYLQGRWTEAEHALNKALKLAPEDARVRTNLGLALAASGRSQEALTLLSRSGGDAIGHANLGYLLASTGQFDLARQQYQTALAMRPDLALARRALAQLDRQQEEAGKPGSTSTIMASTPRPKTRPNDSGVIPASAPRVPSPPRTAVGSVQMDRIRAAVPGASSAPPMPARVTPAAHAAGPLDRRAIPAVTSRATIPSPQPIAAPVDSPVIPPAASGAGQIVLPLPPPLPIPNTSSRPPTEVH
jgi:Flp pilus assembly protein TadD